jgi:hypothetical protein
MSSRPIYIALLLFAGQFARGIDSVIALINTMFPDNTLVIEKYTVDGQIDNVIESLDDFLAKYPTGDRCTISTHTVTLTEICTYLDSISVVMPNFSLSASSITVKNLNNALTYNNFDQFSAMSNFMVFRDYHMKRVKILYDADTIDDVFFQQYIGLVEKQAGLLDIPYSKEVLAEGRKYDIGCKSMIVVLCRTANLVAKYLDKRFFKSIPDGCFVCLTDVNDDCGDIFKDVPAYVCVPTPLNFTETSQMVFEACAGDGITDVSFIVYPWFDILYTLNYLSGTDIVFSLENYVNLNPFTEIPAAWSNANAFVLSENGSVNGTYNLLMTKNVLVEKHEKLFKKHNTLEFALPDSYSIFRTAGIVAFFRSGIYYCEENYYEIYDKCGKRSSPSSVGKLRVVRFDKNNTTYRDDVINVSEIVENKFVVRYDDEGFFVKLDVIVAKCGEKNVVNATMGKKPIKMVLV